MTEKVKLVSVPELFIEVHHERGNFSKFEVHNGTEWVEANVWDYRAMPERVWQAWGLLPTLPMEDTPLFRVTRYPDLERDILDNTYHPSVGSWKIDPDKVKEFFDGK
jgi:hypothetical protein